MQLPNRLLGIALLLAAGCASDPWEVAASEKAIVGGSPTSVGQYPNVVAVSLGGGLCTGTLVAPNVVVTAAHCVLPEPGETQQAVTARTQAIFDTTDVRSGTGKAVAAASTLPQPLFSLSSLGRYDIGVVILSSRVTDRAPAPIVRDPQAVPAGALVTLVGYGISRVVNGIADGTSAGTEFVLADKATINCALLGGQNADLICFDQSDGKGSCNGDSGGPAFTEVGGKLTLAGVTSFGDEECIQIGAYTRLTAELAFLEAQMKTAGACNADGVCTPACGAGTLPADPDCSAGGGGTPGDPTTTPPPAGSPSADPDDSNPEVGDPPGLLGGCRIGAGRRGGTAAGSALVLLVALVLTRRRARR